MSMTFIIVGPHDNPVFEMDVVGARSAAAEPKEDHRHFNQFIINAALDHVEDVMWTTSSMYLKLVDRFNDMYISAFVTAGGSKLLLLHETRPDDSLRMFFQECYESYTKICMNPFHTHHTIIRSVAFKEKVRQAAKRYL